LEANISTSTISIIPRPLVPVLEQPTHDPVLNVERESSFLTTAEVPSFRVWRSQDSVILGKFLTPGDEVNLTRSEGRGVPVLRRPSGGGAVFHDLGNVNYSIYLPGGFFPGLSIDESLRLLSFPVTDLLDSFGIDWSWEPPNNVYVRGAKISGSAQARSKGRLLHHGTLLVDTDLEKMRQLLKPGGRSCIAPVVNLVEIVPGITTGEVEKLLFGIFTGKMPQSQFDITYATWWCRRTDTILGTCLEEWINVR
jgi:lipoyltransferase/lipoate-protein ligase